MGVVGSRGTVQERFDAKVTMTDECWVWNGAQCGQGGYGQMWAEGRNRRAHHVALWLREGVWPDDVVMHLCDNPSCVRYEHLRAGSQKDNMADAVKKGRVGKFADIHCKHGHEYTDANTILDRTRSGGVRRACRTCRNMTKALSYKRRRAAEVT